MQSLSAAILKRAKLPIVAVPAGVSAALWAKQEVCHAEGETCRPAWRGDRRRRWSATFTLCQRRVSHGHGAMSPIHDWTCLVAGAEPTVAERCPTWQGIPSLRRKWPRGALHAWAGRMFSRGTRGCPVAVRGDLSLRKGGHFSHATPSPSLSWALCTIHLGNPYHRPCCPVHGVLRPLGQRRSWRRSLSAESASPMVALAV